MEHCNVIITKNNYGLYKDEEYRNEHKNVNDGIYIGRYILISYGEDEFTKKENSPNEAQAQPLFVITQNNNKQNNFDSTTIPDVETEQYIDKHSIELSTQNLLSESVIATKSNEQFKLNLSIDLETYGNSYHNTVWMKVYRNGTEEYIMIAELNAKAPQLGIEVINPAIKSYTATGETWQEPYFDLSKSTDLYYTLQMPKTLRYFTKEPNINLEGFDYITRNEKLDEETEITNNLKSENNKIQWQYGQVNENNNEETFKPNSGDETKASAKQLQIELPALGQIASLLYDILFGIPSNPGGIRPGAKDNAAVELIQSVLEEDLGNPNNGLLLLLHGILKNGKWQPDWQSNINDSGSILNKPKIIGVNDEDCDYCLNYNDNNDIFKDKETSEGG